MHVPNNDIHAQSICGRLADKGSAFHSLFQVGCPWLLEIGSGLEYTTQSQALQLECTGFCRIFATELEDRRPKTVPYLEEVVE